MAVVGRLQVWTFCVWLCLHAHAFPQSKTPQYPQVAVLQQYKQSPGLSSPPQTGPQLTAQQLAAQLVSQQLAAQQQQLAGQKVPLYFPSQQQPGGQKVPQWFPHNFQQQGGKQPGNQHLHHFHQGFAQPFHQQQIVQALLQQQQQQQAASQRNPQRSPPQPQVAPAQPVDKCSVADYEQVPCGQTGISGTDCTAINCCFDGTKCFYGKTVTVQCVRDGQFVVVVATDVTVPPLSLDSVHMLNGSDPHCSPVASTPYFGIYQFPVTACGTTVSESNGYVVYENRMFSSYEVGIGPYGSITRDSHFEALFQCRYSDSAVEAVVVEVDTVPVPPPVAALGPLRVELRLANGNCVTKGCAAGDEAYSSYYNVTDYPVTKVLRQPVYVEVRILARTDPNIFLMLDHCWATSTPSPLSLPQWDLLVNGCPYQDDRYQTLLVPIDVTSGLTYPTHYKRFIVKMFTFVDSTSLAPLKETVYIHCSTAVCHPDSTGSCNQSCARKKREVPADTTTREQTVVSSGAITFVSS